MRKGIKDGIDRLLENLFWLLLGMSAFGPSWVSWTPLAAWLVQITFRRLS